MVTNIAGVLSAYRQSGNPGGDLAGAADSSGKGGSFADALKNFGTDAVDAIKAGEQAAAAGASGKANLASVVTAMDNADMMLQTVVAIRDKVIAAYQSIVQTAI
ncbi:MAG TPA: flagellar hook-basal body complex protein FliE [Alphaproteobacteria bacterium]|nr:flagellar hook-basal body complex protein FliE [Alphaproteobacteria bacterium]